MGEVAQGSAEQPQYEQGKQQINHQRLFVNVKPCAFQIIPEAGIGLRDHFGMADAEMGKLNGKWREGHRHAMILVGVDGVERRLAFGAAPRQLIIIADMQWITELEQIIAESLQPVSLFDAETLQTGEGESYIEGATRTHYGLRQVGAVDEVVAQAIDMVGVAAEVNHCRLTGMWLSELRMDAEQGEDVAHDGVTLA